MSDKKLWANSGDSHFLEPDDLWRARLPKHLADLVPRSEKDPDGKWETVFVDGQAFRRRLPNIAQEEFYAASHRAPGANNVELRLKDLDEEGIWTELIFPSLGMWSSSFRTPEVLREALRVSNDWAKETIMDYSPRLVPTAQVSTLVIQDACDELKRCGELGYKAVFMPVTPHPQQKDYNRDEWEPFWALAEDIGMVIAFHIGTEPIDFASGGASGIAYRGPGGAVLNYTETTFGGQRAVMKLVASGALDRHPNLKVLVSEGGATWVPSLPTAWKRLPPALDSRTTQAEAQPQGDHLLPGLRVVPARRVGCRCTHRHGLQQRDVGQRLPAHGGTYGHTQLTLHNLFDSADQKVKDRIMHGTFEELFPGSPKLPAVGTEKPAIATV